MFQKTLNQETFTLQLIITEDCNLRCRYCFEQGKNPKQMSIEVAKNILDTELNQDSEIEHYTVELSGGEPFLQFELIKEIVEYAKSNVKKWNKKIIFFIASNITLFNDEIRQWLFDNKGWVFVGTSLDGVKEIHDFNRSDSYDTVMNNICFIRKNYPTQPVKMTIGPDSIPYVSKSIKHIEKLKFPFSANVVFEDVWGSKKEKRKYLKIFAEQLESLVQFYTENKELPMPFQILNLPIQVFNRKEQEKESEPRWCGSGKYMRAYDTEGKKFPCHRFTQFCANKHFKEEDITNAKQVNNKCTNCEFIEACPTCAGYNWEVNNNIYERTSYHCEFMKLQFLASAKLIYNRNKAFINDINSNKDIEMNDANVELLHKIKAANKVIQILSVDKILKL